MAVIHWLGGVNSDFNTAGNWGGGVVPLVGDDAIIDLAGAAVVSSADNSVNTLAVIGTASLSIASGTFTVISGSGSGNLAGHVTVADGATLSIGGTIVNSGTINESSAGTTTKIVLNQTTNILQGGGQVILSANANNQIIGAKSTFLLDNQNNTISGSGQLGSSFMALSNEGVINANKAAAALTVDTAGNVIINAGTMEATGGGSLTINSPVNNVGGTIEAVGAGSIVFLQASVTGGTVFSSGGGQIKTPSGNITLDGLGLHPVTNGTALPVLNGNTITLLGNIINNGTINLNSAGANTDLRVGSPIVTLQGKGAITLTNQPNNRIFGNNGAFQLINQGNTISGAASLARRSLRSAMPGWWTPTRRRR